jgi:hypothetical protein
MVHVLCTTTAIGLILETEGRRCEAEAQKINTTEFITVLMIYVQESFGSTPQEGPTRSCVQDETELPRVTRAMDPPVLRGL